MVQSTSKGKKMMTSQLMGRQAKVPFTDFQTMLHSEGVGVMTPIREVRRMPIQYTTGPNRRRVLLCTSGASGLA